MPPGLIREDGGVLVPPPTTPLPSAGIADVAATPLPEPRLQSFDDWIHRCSDVRVDGNQIAQCELLQVRQVQQEEVMVNILILAMAEIASEKESEKPAILLTSVVPLDVFLPEGIRFLVDGNEIIHLPYQNCNRQGCWSRAILDEAVITALRRGNNGLARFAVINGQGAEVQFSLKGFTAGLEALQKGEAQ